MRQEGELTRQVPVGEGPVQEQGAPRVQAPEQAPERAQAPEQVPAPGPTRSWQPATKRALRQVS